MASPSDPDLPPSFPMLDSAQRIPAHTGVSTKTNTNNNTNPSSHSSSSPPNPSFTVSGPTRSATASTAPTYSSSSSSTSSTSASTKPSGSSKVQALRSVLDSPPPRSLKATPSSSASSSTSSLMPPPSSTSSLMPPPSTSRLTAPQGVGGASGASLSSSSPAQTLIPGETSGRKKVILKPGRSPLDWARLKASNDPQVLREGHLPLGIGGVQRIPMSEVKKHVKRDSCWSVLNGMVYNLTPYLEFHPGGEKELMRVAGRDGTRLFMLTHSWVNIDAMIDTCCIGIVVKDE